MELSEIEDTESISLLGEGVRGTVYIGKKPPSSKALFPDHELYAIRVFNAMTINRKVIEGVVKRLNSAETPEGVMPAVWKTSSSGSQALVMPLMADKVAKKGTDDVTYRPRTLQLSLDKHPRRSSWKLTEKIVHAIANLHQLNIPHGNLKPGNIFFKKDNSVLLADFALGHMPDLSFTPFSDALLYSAPEQMTNPEGYTEGLGYRWDVYAFGVLAYRILTGRFPRCHDVFLEIETQLRNGEDHEIKYWTSDLVDLLEEEAPISWPTKPANEKEKKRREIIERCLSLHPEKRCQDAQEVLRLWHAITHEKELKTAKNKTTIAYAAAGLGASTAMLLGGLLYFSKLDIRSQAQALSTAAKEHEQEKGAIIQSKHLAEKNQSKAEEETKAALKNTATRTKQLIELGETNDQIIAWVMRTQNKNLPQLSTPEPRHELIAGAIQSFLAGIDREDDFSPIKARMVMQLAELKLLAKEPKEADALLDQAIPLWKASDITDSSRVARARLVCLLQSLDLKDTDLTNTLLPKARLEIAALSEGDEIESRRINAVMQIIDGRMIQKSDPEKALKNFELAIKELKGIHDKLPEHVIIRSELAQHTLKSSALAESLMRVDDAARLRSEAAIHLKYLLEKNPSLEFAKIKLAEIEILAAEESMRSGNEQAGITKLKSVEKLLKDLKSNGTSPDSPSFQIAIASGLNAVILRDRGEITKASTALDYAIRITEKIVAAHPEAEEPLYRLAVFYWQRGGLAGTKGEKETELKFGVKSAKLMEKILTLNSRKRGTELRRSLAYLYGNIGTNASYLGKSKEAAYYFKKASGMWTDLIKLYGKKDEYTEGLKWSNSKS